LLALNSVRISNIFPGTAAEELWNEVTLGPGEN
jgi:hypothetical protein